LNIDAASLQLSSDPAEGSSLHQAFLSLDDAEKKLKSIVNVKFDQAVETGNLPEAMRFFKIFPLLNLHRIGLEKFCKHLCLQINNYGEQLLEKTSKIPFNHQRFPVIYSDYLTSLFEYIADIVEAYQPLVETYYGKEIRWAIGIDIVSLPSIKGHGKLFNFISMLQTACDTQVERGMNSFKTQRQFESTYRRVQHIASLTSRSLTVTTAASDLSNTNAMNNGVDRLDPRELDDFLAEITLINASCELYLRFIRRRLNADCEAAYPLVNETKSDECLKQLKDIERFTNQSGLSRLLHEFISQYITIEDYFMRESISKALSLDSTNVVDDVFFILRKCLK
jgi:conserved oligomeric Golgi complex subunit 4